MKIEKLLSLVLSISMLIAAVPFVAGVSAAAATQEQTYGYDNIFDPTKDITIAYLGGSITEQAGYCNRSLTYFTDLKAAQGQGATVSIINTGIGGTPSDLGLYRLKHQILDKKPDVLFVEYAVNDRNRGTTAAKNMEGIVRMCMQAKHQPCVIFVVSAHTDFDLIAGMAARYKTVADYYNVGFIDFNAHMKAKVEAGEYIWDKTLPGTLTNDGTHPNNEGHLVYGNFIIDKLVNDNENTLKKLTYRAESLSDYIYGEPKMVPHNDPAIKYTGDWLVSTPGNRHPSTRVSSTFMNFPRFEEGYHEFRTSSNMTNPPTIEYTFTGRSIGIFADRGDSGARASYVIDEGTPNQRTGTINNYYKHGTNSNDNVDMTNTPVGSQMTCSTWLLEGLPYGEHTLKITLSEPTNKEGYYQDLFAFGYFMIDDVKPAEMPTATDVEVTGRQKTGNTLTATYTFKNIGDLTVEEGASTYQWYRSSSKYTGYTPINGATSLEYTTTLDDARKYLQLEITPVNINGLAGAKIYSDPIIIRSSVDVSSNITIESAKLGNLELSDSADKAPVIKVADAITSRFDISGLIDDFGYDITLTAKATDDNTNIIAYTQKKSDEETGEFSFNMKPSKKILPGKTYVITVGGKNVDTTKTYYFKTAVSDENKEYTLSVTAAGGTIYNNTNSEDWAAGKTADYAMDTVLSLKAVANEDSTFLYWMDTESNMLFSTDAEIEFKVGTGKKLTAIFADTSAYYTVTFRDINNKIVSIQNSLNDITAPSNSFVMGYTFSGWVLDSKENLTPAGTVIPKENIKDNTLYVAGYTPDSKLYKVTVNGAIQTSGSYRYNTKLSYTPDESNGTFSYWTKDGKIVSYDKTYTFYVASDCTIEAVFNESAEKEPILAMATPTLVNNDKIAFFFERNIPEEYELIETGILVGKSPLMTVTDYEYKAKSASTDNIGQFTVRKANIDTVNDKGITWYGIGYVIYKSGDTMYIKYTSPVSYTI